MKTNLKVKVIDKHSKECLFECPVEETEKAYEYAASLDEMGLEVEVITPNIADTLSLVVDHPGIEECDDGSCATTYTSIEKDKDKLH